MTKRIIAFILAAVMAFCLASCAGTENPAETGTKQESEKNDGEAAPQTVQEDTKEPEKKEEAPSGTSEARTFTDDCGRTVEIPSEITKIVASGPLAQIIVFAIAPDMLVGLASKWDAGSKGFIDEKYMDLPFFGQLYGSADLNVEELALAGPELVVDVGEAKKSIVEDMDDLQAQTTIPSVHIEASLKSMPEAFVKLGELLGREEKAAELAGFCEKVYQRTLKIMESVGENKVNAMYILGEEGLNVLAKDSYHAELIDMLTNNVAVVENPAGKGTGNEVSLEQIALWNPDFIMFAPGSIYSAVSGKDGWSEITAVSTGNYIEVPEGPHNWMGSPPSVQRYLGLIWLTEVLYPEYCDYDVKEDVTEYYRLFYGCELTDEQYGALTANAFLK